MSELRNQPRTCMAEGECADHWAHSPPLSCVHSFISSCKNVKYFKVHSYLLVVGDNFNIFTGCLLVLLTCELEVGLILSWLLPPCSHFNRVDYFFHSVSNFFKKLWKWGVQVWWKFDRISQVRDINSMMCQDVSFVSSIIIRTNCKSWESGFLRTEKDKINLKILLWSKWVSYWLNYCCSK